MRHLLLGYIGLNIQKLQMIPSAARSRLCFLAGVTSFPSSPYSYSRKVTSSSRPSCLCRVALYMTARTPKLFCGSPSPTLTQRELSHYIPVFLSLCDVLRQQRQVGLYPADQKKHSLHLHSGSSFFQRASMAAIASENGSSREHHALSQEDEKMRQHLREIFLTAVDAAMPMSMLEKVMTFHASSGQLVVGERHYAVGRNVFVVGFGKAVLGMACVVENLLGPHIIRGILSIPFGAREDFCRAGKEDMLLCEGSKISVQEGAANNQPDSNAHRTACDIHHLVSNLTDNDIVIVLISGGGSALLPYPIDPLGLEELACTTQQLFNHGATIGDVNTVRKHLEVLKGGGLALAAMPAQVISLIISDVIGDSLDLIASGPTVRHAFPPHHCLEVIDRLGARQDIPDKVIDFLENKKADRAMQSELLGHPRGGVVGTERDEKTDWSRVQNVLVGTNAIGCLAAAQRAEQLGFISLVLSNDLSGEAKEVGGLLAKLAQYVFACCRPRVTTMSNTDLVQLELDIAQSGIKKTSLNQIAAKANCAYNSSMPLCIVAGGETFVKIVGSGKGGRNQEMVLAAGIQLQKRFQVMQERKQKADVFFLSGGTDGQDGPTLGAGAMVDENFVLDARAQDLDPQACLDNNDSHTLWTRFAQSRDLLVTGLTGTNIMDIQLLIVRN